MAVLSKYMIILLLNFMIINYEIDNINFQSRALLKELKKYGVLDFSEVEETNFDGILKDSLNINGKFFKIISDISQVKYIYIGRVNSCRVGSCYTSNKKSSEYFDYFMIFDKNFSIKVLNIFNYNSSHGQEITSKGWLKQFEGYNSNNELNIDVISGATISVNALITDVKYIVGLLNTNKELFTNC